MFQLTQDLYLLVLNRLIGWEQIQNRYFQCHSSLLILLHSGMEKKWRKILCICLVHFATRNIFHLCERILSIFSFADIDECVNQDGACPPPGTCINTLGSYRCMCPKGYKLDLTGTYCVNLADCPSGNCNLGCNVSFFLTKWNNFRGSTATFCGSYKYEFVLGSQ